MCNLAHERTIKHIRAGSTKTMSGGTRHTDLSPCGDDKRSWDKDRGVKTARSKECYYCETSSHNKSEHGNLSAAVRQKFARRGRTSRHVSAEVDPEAGKKKCSRGVA